MTKTLTEQWSEGTLPFGAYYVNYQYNNRVWLYKYRNQTPENTIGLFEVVAPVPSYDHFSQLVKKVERLQEQLKEANNLFLKIQNKLEDEPEEKTMTETRIYELIDFYLTKWIGKDWWMKNDI